MFTTLLYLKKKKKKKILLINQFPITRLINKNNQNTYTIRILIFRIVKGQFSFSNRNSNDARIQLCSR